MMQFLTRWRLSRCHDDGRTPSEALRARAARSAPLDRYARTLDAIDRELSGSAPIADPPAPLMRRTLEAVSALPAASAAAPARAPLWPLLTSLTVAAVALMLFVARPWHSPHSLTPSQPVTKKSAPRNLGAPDIVIDLRPDDRTTREAAALLAESRDFAESFLRDALPFATGPAK